MWWKNHKWKVILPAVLAVILAFTFWYGGNSPAGRGWTVEQPASPSSSQTGEMANSSTPEPSAPPDSSAAPESTPESTEGPAQEPEAEPSPAPPQQPPADTAPETGKDQYQTDPVPEGKPAPVEPQNAEVTGTDYTCTISISCATILNNLDFCDPNKVELVPEDGWILRPTPVTFNEGESVFDVLQRVCKQNRIHMEFSNTPIYNSAYIEGIYNLYEFDVGNLSGWMYQVNGWFPNYGCSRYQLSDGDVIQWVYTCDLGSDVGGGSAVGQQG